MSWVFENVVIATITIVMKYLLRWLNEDKCCHYISKLNISQIAVTWEFENAVILIETMVMDDFIATTTIVLGV